MQPRRLKNSKSTREKEYVMLARERIGPWLLCLAAIAWLSAGCGSSTKVEQTWTAPNAQRAPLGNVVTVCFSDGTMRRNVEDAMARKLAEAGIHATPSYTLLSDQELQQRDAAKAKLASAGFDGVVALRLVSKEHQLQYIPSTFDGYWGPGWGMAYDPGDVAIETVLRVETSAYSLTSGQLVWSEITKTVDPDSPRQGIDQVTTVAAREMQKDGILASAARPAGA
jgi:hypothetical protein